IIFSERIRRFRRLRRLKNQAHLLMVVWFVVSHFSRVLRNATEVADYERIILTIKARDRRERARVWAKRPPLPAARATPARRPRWARVLRQPAARWAQALRRPAWPWAYRSSWPSGRRRPGSAYPRRTRPG